VLGTPVAALPGTILAAVIHGSVLPEPENEMFLWRHVDPIEPGAVLPLAYERKTVAQFTTRPSLPALGQPDRLIG
jgi:hypothetical protein